MLRVLDGVVNAREGVVRVNEDVYKRQVSGMLVGAGTLLTPEQAQAACRAGASFGVAPGFDPRCV